jgi:hypothetical protein
MNLDLNVVLPLASSVLSFIFAALLVDQWLQRRRPYQLIWAVGMLWYGISAGTEFLGGYGGWSEPLYKVWYLVGAIWVAGWLGLGTAYLLGKTRFGYAFAFSLILAGLFTFLSWRRYDYPDSGISAYVYFALALVLAIVVVVLQARGSDRWTWAAGAAIVGGSLVSLVMVVTATLPPPGWAVDPATHIPTGVLMPGYLRLLTPFFNVTGAFALTLGALYSAYVFMPKVRVIRYSSVGKHGLARLTGLLVAPFAIIVNFVASVPAALDALVHGRLNTRVPATILIAVGGLIPAITSGANRFGATSGFFVGEFLGVLFLFAGFLVSIEVFQEFRIPFTHTVLARRTSH